MKRDWVLTEEAFDRLLKWLAEDREQAAEVYEQIRQRLIRILARRGCLNPEDLTDEVFNRVTGKLETLAAEYSGDRLPYFIKVAQLVYLESLKTSPPPVLINAPEGEGEVSYECLELCLKTLPAEQRELILAYYEEEKMPKIAGRKGLAERMKIKPHALRMRIHRIKGELQRCVEKCLEDRGEL